MEEKHTRSSPTKYSVSQKRTVKINSIVNIKTSFGYKHGLQIVSNETADISLKKLSVLSALGSAIIGREEGDIVTWDFDGEPDYVEILQIIQPNNRTTSTFMNE